MARKISPSLVLTVTSPNKWPFHNYMLQEQNDNQFGWNSWSLTSKCQECFNFCIGPHQLRKWWKTCSVLMNNDSLDKMDHKTNKQKTKNPQKNSEFVSQSQVIDLKVSYMLRATLHHLVQHKFTPAMAVNTWKNCNVDVPELISIYIDIIESKIYLIIYLESFILLCITITVDN